MSDDVLYPNPRCELDEILQEFVCLHMLHGADSGGMGELSMRHFYEVPAVKLFGKHDLVDHPMCLEAQQEHLVERGWATKNGIYISITDDGIRRMEEIRTRYLEPET